MLKKLHSDNAIILKNFSYLSFLKVFNIGTKFLLVAYLVRILGEFNYGILTWSDAIIQYFLMFINFGFNVYAAKYIVEFRDKSEKINEIISSIFTIKFALFLASFLILYALTFLRTFELYQNILFLMLLMGLGEVFFPIWYFQGIERIKPATYIVTISKIALIAATLLFVKSPEDLPKYVLFVVVSGIIMGALGFWSLVKKHDFSFVFSKMETLKSFIKEAYLFFVGTVLSLTFNLATIFLIGIYFTMEFVTGFDVALKIVLVSIIPFDILQQAMFPTISRTRNKSLLKKLIIYSFFIAIIFSGIIFLFSEQLLGLFGGAEMIKHTDLLKTLAFVIPFGATTFMLGTCTLVAFGYHKDYNYSLLISSAIFAIIVLALLFFDKMTFWNLVYLRIFSDFVLVIIRLYFTFKRKILTV